MKACPRFLWLLLLLPLLPSGVFAQVADPYHLNGSATQDNCNCYTLTPDQMTQSGSVWNKTEIDLSQSFNFQFNVYLGCKDLEGADGIVFVLQPISTSIGFTGQGLGFEGIVPSIGIPIDTYQNIDYNDPSYDHIGIYRDGDLHNGSANTLAGPVMALPNNSNIEDCQWHLFRIDWNATTKTLTAYVDGVQRVQTQTDLVANIFGGKPLVYWGFSGATGGSSNVQKFCTSLNAGFSLPSNQKTCYPTPVAFQDSSASFGSIVNWFWDFGDGTKSNLETPPPHVFPQPGIYNVKLNILGNNGCLSDTFTHQIIAGSKPTASFTAPTVACTVQPTLFTDASQVQFGTIDEWHWNIDAGSMTADNDYPGIAETFPEGIHSVQLITDTREGCVSDPYDISFTVFPKPAATASIQDACYGSPVILSAANTNAAVSAMKNWQWDFGDSTLGSGDPVSHLYAKGAEYPVSVFGESTDGCYSDTVAAVATVYQSFANAGRDTVITLHQSLALQATGGSVYHWSPATGLSDPNSADPTALIEGDIDYVLEASTPVGCPTYDTIHIKSYVGPDIYVPSGFTPDHNGHNDVFHPVTVGITRLYYFRVFNRFGQLVYDSVDSGAGWDGTFRGQPQPSGAYVWMIRALDYTGAVHTKQGTVVLIR